MTSPRSPANRVTAERIITQLYAHIGRSQPGFLWFDDPLSSVLACNLLRLLEKVDPSRPWRGESVRLAFKRPAGGHIGSVLRVQLENDLRATKLLHQLRAREGLPSALLNCFWSSFWWELEGLLGAVRTYELRHAAQVYGFLGDARAFGALMLSDVEGFWGGAVEGGLERPLEHGVAAARLDALQRACGWWCPLEHVVICSDGPQRILVDAEGRLHNERGPAVALCEDHAHFAWHGTRIPAEWIEQRGALDPWIALTWPNVEQRRAAAEIIGWSKVLSLVPTRVVHADPDPEIGTLLECDLPDFAPARFLRVRCGTGREFALGVPREMRTARQANAWTYGLQSDDYQLEVRT